MTQPALLVVSSEPEAREEVTGRLISRYSGDYEVITERSTSAATGVLERLEEEDRLPALLLVDGLGPDEQSILSRTRERHPTTQRGLVISMADWVGAISLSEPAHADAIRRAIASGQIDFWTLIPSRSPDEDFHGHITAALREWARSVVPPAAVVDVVGRRWASRSHELRDLLRRNNVAHGFHDVSSEEGRRLLESTGVGEDRLPVVVFFDGRTLVDPTTPEFAKALGVQMKPAETTYDVVVVGAGLAGLAASVYATSEGLQTALLEREAVGGQAGTTSLIRNYLGFPHGISGQDLAQRAYEQAWLLGTELVYGNAVAGLRSEGPVRVVTLADGTEIRTKAVVLATGVSYRRLGISRLDALIGAGVYYGAATTEAEAVADDEVFVVGGGNSAGQAAVHLAKFAKKVTVLVREGSLAESMSEYLIKELGDGPNIEIRHHVEVVDGRGEGRLTSLTIENTMTGDIETVDASALFVLIGGEPHTDWLPDEIRRDRWGYVLTGSDLRSSEAVAGTWPIKRPPMDLETSMRGVFAVGDARHGSMKRVASAVGEGSSAIRLVHAYLAEQRDGEQNG